MRPYVAFGLVQLCTKAWRGEREHVSVTNDTNVRPSIHQLGASAAAYESAVWGERFWSGARLAADVVLLALAAAIAAFSWPNRRTRCPCARPVLFGVIVVCTSLARGTYRRRIKLDSLDDLRSTGWVIAVATSVVVHAAGSRRRQPPVDCEPHRPARAPGRAPRRRRPGRPQLLAAADETSGQGARSDSHRRRGPRRTYDRQASAQAPGTRSPAGGLPRQGAPRCRQDRAACPFSGRAGISRALSTRRDRAGDRHLLDRAE